MSYNVTSRVLKLASRSFALFILLLTFSTAMFSQEITHFRVNGGWSGNDPNGNAIIKWTITVCTDGPTMPGAGVDVFAPTNSNGGGDGGTDEDAGTIDVEGDDNSPAATNCGAGSWSGPLSGNRTNPKNTSTGQITPNGGLNFSGAGCATLSWTHYSKDYDSSSDDENHYVVAETCVGCGGAGFTYDCSSADGNGNGGCPNGNTSNTNPDCVNKIDCHDVETHNYEQILGLKSGLDTVIAHKEGYVEVIMAHIACHHGESDYIAGNDRTNPGNNNYVDIIPEDIGNIIIETREFNALAGFGTLDSVRLENPGTQLLMPAAAFAPYGSVNTSTGTGNWQALTDGPTSILPMDASQNDMNKVTDGSCGAFVEVCDTIYVHKFYTKTSFNPGNNGAPADCERYFNIQSRASNYMPADGTYQSTGDDDGVSESPPTELSDRLYNVYNAGDANNDDWQPDDEDGDCSDSPTNTCGAGPGDDCSAEAVDLCIIPPTMTVDKNIISFTEDITNPDNYIVEFEVFVCNDASSSFILENVDLEDPLVDCIPGASVVMGSVEVDPTVIPSVCVANDGFPVANAAYNGDADINLTDGLGAIDPGSCFRVTFTANIPYAAFDAGSDENKANASADDISGLFSTPVTAADSATIPLPSPDLALTKTFNTVGPVSPGQDVTFTINIENQGDLPMDSVKINDYVPAGYNFRPGPSPNGWVEMGDTIMYILKGNDLDPTDGRLDPMDMTSIDIVLRVQRGFELEDYVNIAEIGEMWDTLGIPRGNQDVDSYADSDPFNDAGGAVDTDSDDVTMGDGSGEPGDTSSDSDEDDSDPAAPPIFDLALIKTVSNSSMPADGVYDAGDTIVFEVYVVNQGTADATEILVKDTMPCGFVYADDQMPGWDSAGDPIFLYTIGSLDVGADTTIMIAMELKTSMDVAMDCAGTGVDPDDWYTNFAYIEEAKDENGTIADDIDSNAGSFTGREMNTFPNSDDDNVLDSKSNGDVGSQDDSDPASIVVFDLAITKTINPDNNPYTTGDTVTFEICVENENMVATDSIGITDYLPSGYSYISTPGNMMAGQSGWTYDLSTGEATIAIVDFPAGDSLGFGDQVCVVLELEVQTEDDYTNVAEINEAQTIVERKRLNGMGEVVLQRIDRFLVNSDNDGTFGNGEVVVDTSLDSSIDEEAAATIEIEYLSLGNQVWNDANNNGIFDAGEDGINGVIVELHFYDPQTMMCELVGVDTTSGDGFYLFDSLGGGDYIVVIPASNFDMGEALGNLISSTGSGPSNLTTGPNEDATMQLDPDLDITNEDDNGVLDGNSMFPGAVVSDTVTLEIGMEPVDEGSGNADDGNGGSVTTDENNNLTIDFGFTEIHSIGNQVWADANNNGILDPGEELLDSVLVILHYYDPVTMTCVAVDSVLTGTDGEFLFDSLGAGQYLVELDDTNFLPGGPFDNYVSSTGNDLDLMSGPFEDSANQLDPDDNVDNDDNGTLVTSGPLAGGILSDTIDLGNDEAQMEAGLNNDMSGAPDSLSNLTVDFGLVPLHSIGNQVWIDANNNGMFDDGEEPIEGVMVVLHYINPDGSGCDSITTVVTDDMGLYLFDSLIMGDYIIEIPGPANNPSLVGYVSSTGSGPGEILAGVFEDPNAQIDPDNDVNNDDNGVLNGNNMFTGSFVSDTLSLSNDEPLMDTIPNNDMSGAVNENSNLSVDFGFVPLHSLGNQVWDDANNNGSIDPGEEFVEGVIVELHYVDPVSGCVLITMDTTDELGLYLFDSLTAGDYIVVLSADNFDPGGALEGYISSTGGDANLTAGPNEDTDNPIDADANNDGDDIGILNGNAMFPGAIASDTISLGGGDEALNEDPDNDTSDALDENSNLTIDFGVVRLHSLGNQVWRDDNNNGQVDDGEIGIADVLIYLHHYDPATMTCTIVDSTTTDMDGFYLFDSLIAGQYLMEIPASNFNTGLDALNGMVSSTGAGTDDLAAGTYEDVGNQIDPQNNTNLDDNGVLNGVAMWPGSIASDTIVLGDDEPQMEGADPLDTDYDMSGANDSLSNLTIDFGFVPLHSLGNQVWIDTNNDGVINEGEEGIAGIEVVLHYYNQDSMKCFIIDTVVTDADGFYLFDSLIAGDYIVELPATNFGAGEAGDGLISSSGGLFDLNNGPNEDPNAVIDPDDNENLDDNGLTNGNSMFPIGSIASDTITLETDLETTMEGEDPLDSNNDDSGAQDDRSNLTLDFGLTPMYSVGNTVWLDDDYDGLYEPGSGELGLDGVTVILHYFDPVTGMCIAVDTTVTMNGGMYLFDSLLMGDYLIEIPATELAPGGILRDYLSSTGTFNMGGVFEDATNPIDPDSNTDRDDNGIFNSNSNFPLAVFSDTLTLGGMEPSNEIDDNDNSNALDANSNLTVDFGFGEKVFDLALRKELAVDQPAAIGDTVKFLISLFNQGNMDATNILITDYVPAGLGLAAGSPNNGNWVPSGPDYTYSYEDTLAAGATDTICITLEVLPGANPENVVNMAEITEAADTLGNDNLGNGPDGGVYDEDSTPDGSNINDNGNDLYSDLDDIIDENAFNGEDEDDHDQAAVNFCEGMFCKGSLNISLDEMCMAGLTPAMLLEGTIYPDYVYTITAVDENGNSVDPNNFTGDDINETFTVTICNTFCDNNCCMIDITIEDKYPPQIACVSDTITCGELIVFPVPVITENCSGAVPMMINETYTPVDCSDPELQTIVTREWIAIDAAGNESEPCIQTLSIAKFDIGTVEAPLTTEVDLECGVPYPNIGVDIPDPEFYGSPRLGGVNLFPQQFLECNLMVNYSDQTIPTSPSNYSIVRTWTATTWICGVDSTRTFVQIFNIEDTEGPAFTCPGDMSFSTSGIDCSADVDLPVLAVQDLCGDVVSVTVQYDGGFINSNGGEAALPAGNSVVTYTATDSNGNSNSCSFNVSVTDDEQPIPVCEQFTTIGLTNDGTAIATASMFDDGSFDACGPVTLEIRRMDASCDPTDVVFGESITFCCADLDAEQMVVLRVTDQSGNTNECMIMAEITDKIAPIYVVGLPDITLSCEFPFNQDDTEQFGSIVFDENDREDILLTAEYVEFGADAKDGLVLGNCLVLESDEFTSVNIDACGQGIAYRFVTVRNSEGQSVTDVQILTFINPSPFNASNIDFPNDISFNNLCDVTQTLPGNLPAGFSEPVITEDGCDQIGYDFVDQFIDDSNGAESCYKILRTWTIADWCQKNPDGSFKTFTDQQVITVTNNSAPVITGDCSDISVCSYDVDCGPFYLELTNNATDDCTDSVFLNWSYAIDFDSDSSIDLVGSTNDASGTYPVGVHTISWIVNDACGNEDNCSYVFEIKNCKSATPICIDDLTIGLEAIDTDNDNVPDDEQATIKAKDFDGGSYHVCGLDLQFSFSANVNDTVKVFNCNDIGLQPIQMWVTDTNGNQDFCVTSIDVQDNNMDTICMTSMLVFIEGEVKTEMDEMVANANVILEGGDIADMTEDDGQYDFLDMPMGGTYTVNPLKDIGYDNGITTLDIVLVQKHILGIEILNSPYKMIAADVNHSDNITGQDIIQIRRLLLGLDDEFPDNTSWRFIDDAHTFLDATNPWVTAIPETYAIPNLSTNMTIDFKGVKIGDVNNTASPNELVAEHLDTRSADKLDLAIDSKVIPAGRTWIPVYADNFEGLQGIQLGLTSDADILDVRASNLSIDKGSFKISEDARSIKMIWYSGNPVSLEKDAVLFEIQVDLEREMEANQLFSVSDDVMRNESYDEVLAVNAIDIVVRGENSPVNADHSSLEIAQNEPNPWRTSTIINVESDHSGQATLSIMDMAGKVVLVKNVILTKGTSSIQLTSQELPTTGVLYYELAFGDTKIMKKMILIK